MTTLLQYNEKKTVAAKRVLINLHIVSQSKRKTYWTKKQLYQLIQTLLTSNFDGYTRYQTTVNHKGSAIVIIQFNTNVNF